MKRARSNILFICGTDTDVGKTLIAGALLAHLTQQTIDVFPCKPFESGVTGKRPDTEFLRKMCGQKFSADEINFYHFAEALAPCVAAARMGQRVDFKKVVKRIQARAREHKLVIVEGAGGLLVPLSCKNTNLDLIRALKADVLLVSRLELGSINHTRLTFDRLLQEKISVRGIVLNQTQKKKSLAALTNPDVLTDLGVPVLGVMPYLKVKTAAALAKALPVKVKSLL